MGEKLSVIPVHVSTEIKSMTLGQSSGVQGGHYCVKAILGEYMYVEIFPDNTSIVR